MDRLTLALASTSSRTLERSLHRFNHIFDKSHVGILLAQTIVENFSYLRTVSEHTSGHGHRDTVGIGEHLVDNILRQSDELFRRLSQNLTCLLVLLFGSLKHDWK